jgi:hypothetical protein
MKERQRLRLADVMSRDSGPTLTPYDVARISREAEYPVSHDTVLHDIERGDTLTATPRPRGGLFEYHIAFVDAKRYLIHRCGASVARETTTQSTQSTIQVWTNCPTL